MDTVLVNPGGREKIYQSLGSELTAVEPPLWCRLIGGYLINRGFEIDICDTEALEIGPDALAERVEVLNPRIVTIVVFGHQPSASTQQMVGAREAALAIKKRNKDRKIIIVGGHVSALPERTLREEPIDFACNGEGPETIAGLLNLSESKWAINQDLETVPGLVWWDTDYKKSKVLKNSPAPVQKDLDTEFHGNVWHMLPMEKYRAHNWQCFEDLSHRQPYASIYTTLGCPYKCVFCCINAPFGRNSYRMRTPSAVISEVDHLYTRYGVKTFKIIDEMFVLNERHVRQICEGLSKKPYISELNFWAYARVDTVREDMISMLRSAGIRWLALGIESGSDHVRDGAEKSFSEDEIFNIVEKIQQGGISVIGNFIFGLPDDTLQSMRSTLDLAKKLNCEFANFYSAMAYPGSRLYQNALENNWDLPSEWSGFSQHSFDCTPLPTDHLSSAEVLKFRDQAFHEYFENKSYLDMVTQKFGTETRKHIEAMSKTRLPRLIVDDEASIKN